MSASSRKANRMNRAKGLDGHAPKKRLSQNFLVDLSIRDEIVVAGGAAAGTTILEIGPGLGALTEGLLREGARVVAVELDDELIPRLRSKFASEISSGALTLVHGDALDVDLAQLLPSDAPWSAIANIPYHITSPLLHRLLLLPNPAERVVLLVQREVAERVAAPVGDWSYLTAFVRSRSSAQIVRRVPRVAFDPAPAVDSAILLLEILPQGERLDMSEAREDELWRVVQAGFRERRKKLRNALPRALPVPVERITAALESAGIDPDLRAQAIGIDAWLRLAEALHPLPGGLVSDEGDDESGEEDGGDAAEAAPRRAAPRRRAANWVEEDAPGKVNLTLAVIGRRSDGYHELHSVVAPLAFGDHLTLSLTPRAASDELHLAGEPIPDTEENLVLTTLRLVRAALAEEGIALPPISVVLEKRLPVAAGLGGGSSDAAATLRGALRLSGATLSDARLTELAAEIGSDVPLFLPGGPVLMEGRGERITPLAPWSTPPGVLLITPRLPIRTPDVFAAFAAGARGGMQGAALTSSQHLAAEVASGLSADALVQRSAALAAANDLLAPARAIAPWLRPFDHALRRLLGRPLALSGSGPTLFLLYPSQAAAAEGRELLVTALAAGELETPSGEAPTIVATELA